MGSLFQTLYVFLFIIVIFFIFQHLHVIFYYLRKKAKVSPNSVISFITADTLFHQTIEREYANYLKDGEFNFGFEKLISQYILGETILYGKPWVDVDDILFPIHIKTQEQWVLGRLSIKDRCFYVYNSLRSARGDALVLEVVKSYSELLPLYFERHDFFDGRNDIDRVKRPYANKKASNAFLIKMVDDLPQQSTK